MKRAVRSLLTNKLAIDPLAGEASFFVVKFKVYTEFDEVKGGEK